MTNTTSSEKDYHSLQPKDQKKFFNILNRQLIQDVGRKPQVHLQDFYNSVWDTFQEEKKKPSRKKSQNDENIKPKREIYVDPMDPFQIYVRSQSKLRKDEFKHVSEETKQKIFAHEWFTLSEVEKQRIVDENGRFNK